MPCGSRHARQGTSCNVVRNWTSRLDTMPQGKGEGNSQRKRRKRARDVLKRKQLQNMKKIFADLVNTLDESQLRSEVPTQCELDALLQGIIARIQSLQPMFKSVTDALEFEVSKWNYNYKHNRRVAPANLPGQPFTVTSVICWARSKIDPNVLTTIRGEMRCMHYVYASYIVYIDMPSTWSSRAAGFRDEFLKIEFLRTGDQHTFTYREGQDIDVQNISYYDGILGVLITKMCHKLNNMTLTTEMLLKIRESLRRNLRCNLVNEAQITWQREQGQGRAPSLMGM